jgi:hypothetical protein
MSHRRVAWSGARRAARRALALTLALLPIADARATPPAIFTVTSRDARPVTPRYDKFELTIGLSATYDNPFDPDDVEVTAEFAAPSGKQVTIWGFFEPTAGEWRVRFAPTEAGTWRYVVTVRDRAGVARSEPGEFRCAASVHPGFVGVAPNRRYFRYANGESFYGIGLWYNDHFDRGRGAIAEAELDRLRRLGVNFIAFYPPLLETLDTGLGRYDAARAARLDEIFAWCEARDLAISWNLVFHANISEAVWGEGNAEYRRNPYRSVAAARDYFASDAAWAAQQKLNRYIIARWGYSRALVLWFVIDEIDGAEGWTEGDRAAAHAWCRRMNEFFHAHDPYGRPTTGTQSGGVDQWWPEGYEIFDVAARELYEAQGHPMPPGGKPDVVNDHPLRASYRNYAGQTRALWDGFAKPAIIGETGYDHTYYEPGTPGYLATYHNALWATLASGGASTPLWWCYTPEITDGVLTSHLAAFAKFVRAIDFAGRPWRPLAVETSAGDAWAMGAGNRAFGWIANPAAGVARETVSLTGLPRGEYDVHVYHAWRGEYLPPLPVEVADARLTFALPELAPIGGHANNLGDDAAFKITPRGERP